MSTVELVIVLVVVPTTLVGLPTRLLLASLDIILLLANMLVVVLLVFVQELVLIPMLVVLDIGHVLELELGLVPLVVVI